MSAQRFTRMQTVYPHHAFALASHRTYHPVVTRSSFISYTTVSRAKESEHLLSQYYGIYDCISTPSMVNPRLPLSPHITVIKYDRHGGIL